MKCAALQLNLIVGDFDGNARKFKRRWSPQPTPVLNSVLLQNSRFGAILPVIFYSTPVGCRQAFDVLERLAQRLKHLPPTLVGFAKRRASDLPGKPLQNAAALLRDGQVETVFAKSLLPTYDVFDEHRYFAPGHSVETFELNGKTIAVTICEDIWNDGELSRWSSYAERPLDALETTPVDLIVNLSASPYTISKHAIRKQIVCDLSKRLKTPILYANQVGGNDDLLFDGRSFYVDAKGAYGPEAKLFDEDLLIVETSQSNERVPHQGPNESEELFKALSCGVRDYVRKSGFSRVVLGLSGGIDSALTAAIAKYALGAENVLGVLMPSPYSSQGSIDDAAELAEFPRTQNDNPSD